MIEILASVEGWEVAKLAIVIAGICAMFYFTNR